MKLNIISLSYKMYLDQVCQASESNEKIISFFSGASANGLTLLRSMTIHMLNSMSIDNILSQLNSKNLI